MSKDLRPSFPTSVKLNPELREAARERGMNLRNILEAGIREELKRTTCPFCGQGAARNPDPKPVLTNEYLELVRYAASSAKKYLINMGNKHGFSTYLNEARLTKLIKQTTELQEKNP